MKKDDKVPVEETKVDDSEEVNYKAMLNRFVNTCIPGRCAKERTMVNLQHKETKYLNQC